MSWHWYNCINLACELKWLSIKVSTTNLCQLYSLIGVCWIWDISLADDSMNCGKNNHVKSSCDGSDFVLTYQMWKILIVYINTISNHPNFGFEWKIHKSMHMSKKSQLAVNIFLPLNYQTNWWNIKFSRFLSHSNKNVLCF